MESTNKLTFDQSISLARKMLNDENWDDELHKYAVLLLEKMHTKYPAMWDSTWKNDALLGYAYNIILEYDKRYELYKRAFEKANPPPPELLIALARCSIAPGKPPVSEQEAIELVKQAIKTDPYVEGIELLVSLYKSIGNTEEKNHWEEKLKYSNTKVQVPSLIDD